MAGEIHEKCAVAGVLTEDGQEAAPYVYEALFALQHRGVEASGIVAADTEEDSFEAHRERGLVRDVYHKEDMARLCGGVAIGHNRYSTSGSKKKHPQPVVDDAIGLAMAENGNEPDTSGMADYLERHNLRHQSANDTEMRGRILGEEFRRSNDKDLATAIRRSYPYFNGAFSCVATQGGMLAAFRDPCGIRPLALGKFEDNYIVSSETCGLDIIGAEYEREIQPGELVTISRGGSLASEQLAEPDPKLDMFEAVYFTRHDSQLYGRRVKSIRQDIGKSLAKEHPPLEEDSSNRLVVPVPDTSNPIVDGYRRTLDLDAADAIVKNRYIGRTFIQPAEDNRPLQLHRKHSVIAEDVAGRDVTLVDDSIVRLNTMPGLVEKVRASGAKSVSVLVASPPVRFPDFYGIDIPEQSELAAANLTVEEMRQKIGCEYLGFLSLSGLVEAIGLPADKFNLSCFNGQYPRDIGRRRQEIYPPVSMQFAD
jgi:amidophosphoribosyltransferase